MMLEIDGVKGCLYCRNVFYCPQRIVGSFYWVLLLWVLE